jgi:hypothetical protein
MTIAFTIAPTYSGFSDQLMQFNAFYKLGLHLGYGYRHTPFVSERSAGRDIKLAGPAADIHAFVGLNRHFAGQEMHGDALAIELSDPRLAEWRVETLDALADRIRAMVRAAPGTSQVRFQLDGERTTLFSLIQAAMPEFPDGLDLPAIHAEARRHVPAAALHRDAALKILVHVRQGDTSVLATPWGSFLPVWSARADRFREYPRFADIPSARLQFEVADYRRFLDALLDRLGRPDVSTLLFSDGSARAFTQVENNLDKLGWSAEQIHEFRASRAGYDARQFACFAESDDAQLHVGEDPATLPHLVEAALGSDIVIASSQQRMIPKLVANLGRRDVPKVIVLYKQERPDNRDIIRDDHERFIYVDIAKPDFDEVLRRLSQAWPEAGALAPT